MWLSQKRKFAHARKSKSGRIKLIVTTNKETPNDVIYKTLSNIPQNTGCQGALFLTFLDQYQRGRCSRSPGLKMLRSRSRGSSFLPLQQSKPHLFRTIPFRII